jgi:TolA-binding protein
MRSLSIAIVYLASFLQVLQPTARATTPKLLSSLLKHPQSKACVRLLSANRFQKAFSLADQALANDLDNEELAAVKYIKALALLKSKQRLKAIDAFEKLQADNLPAGLASHVAWYYGKLILGNYQKYSDTRIQKAREALWLIPTNHRFGIRARHLLVKNLLTTGEVDKGCQLAKNTVETYLGSYREASARLQVGQCEESRAKQLIQQQSLKNARKHLRQAATIYREIYLFWPRNHAAKTALERFQRLAERKIHPYALEPQHLLERAKQIAKRPRGRRDLYTLKRFRKVLPKTADKTVRSSLNLIFAELCTRYRWFKTAKYYFQLVERQAKSDDLKAQAGMGLASLLARRSSKEAIEKYLAVAKLYPQTLSASWALYKAGELMRRKKKNELAEKTFFSCIEKYPDKPATIHCRWMLAWMAFRDQKYSQALPWLEFLLAAADARLEGDDDIQNDPPETLSAADQEVEIEVEIEDEDEEDDQTLEEEQENEQISLKTHSDLSMRRFEERTRYWRARTREALGQLEQAAADYQRLLEEYPFSYYSLMAWERLNLMGHKVCYRSRPYTPKWPQQYPIIVWD